MKLRTALANLVSVAVVADAQTWSAGDRVLASPTMNENWWMVCVVREPPRSKKAGYLLNCAKDRAKGESLRTVPAKWVRPLPPGARERGKTEPEASPSPSSSTSPIS
jgi:hypothetical protein